MGGKKEDFDRFMKYGLELDKNKPDQNKNKSVKRNTGRIANYLSLPGTRRDLGDNVRL